MKRSKPLFNVNALKAGVEYPLTPPDTRLYDERVSGGETGGRDKINKGQPFDDYKRVAMSIISQLTHSLLTL